MDLRLVSIITPDGRRIPLSATVDQTTFQLQADGGRTSHLIKTTAIGAGSGALGGLVMNAIGGGQKGKGAAIGTGVGAGIGLLGGAIQKGKEFILMSGTVIPFKLDQAIQVQPQAPVQQYGSEYGGFQAPSGYGSYQQAPASDPYGYQQQTPNPYLGN
jgi:outer membrane lipoprotein SlyB